jgi:hypothetical protein
VTEDKYGESPNNMAHAVTPLTSIREAPPSNLARDIESVTEVSVVFLNQYMNIKSTILCDITPCSPLKVNRRFGGTYRLHIQGMLAACFHAGFLLGLFFNFENGGDIFFRNFQLIFNGLHGVISLALLAVSFHIGS